MTQQQIELDNIVNAIESQLIRFHESDLIDLEELEHIIQSLKEYNLKWFGTEKPNLKQQ